MFYDYQKIVQTKILLQHCKETLIYVFPDKELRGFSPNFYIHVPVSDLYIPTFGPPIFCSRIGRPIRGKYKSRTET
jgi:hypothetical protein